MKKENAKNKITTFAVTNFRDIKKRFGIKEKNRQGHMYIVGKTGTGKSTLIENMVISDIREGNGLALIDPHGDLAGDVLDFVPKERVEDVIYFNPQDIEYPVPFNPLEKVSPDKHHLVAQGVISCFKKIWPDFWGPRLEHILRFSLLTLLENPKTTLLEIPKLLTDREFRKIVLKNAARKEIKDFWRSEFEKYSFWQKQEVISPILNKIGQFLASIPLRNIVGQRESTFDLRKVMDEGKVLICSLSKGKIGEDASSLLGAMIVTKLQLAALSRVDLPEEKRRPFYLYVDEIHNFLTLSFADILSEARKYGLNLILAHQYIDQLDEKIRKAVLGNVGTIISFRVGTEDAKHFAREFYPVFKEIGLINLPNYHIYLKLMVNGVTSRPFSALTLPPPCKEKSCKEEIIEFSRKRYARPRKEVEKEILCDPQSGQYFLI